MAKRIGDLPHALIHGDELGSRLARKVPAVFLDYDGTLTPIVDRGLLVAFILKQEPKEESREDS